MAEEMDTREEAIRRLKAKREFKTHVAVYVVVNLGLVGIWLAAGAGYFWPIWSIGGWGIGLFFHWWSTYRESRPITEDDIQREMGRGSQ